MRRIVSLWLPQWPIDRYSRASNNTQQAETIFALTETTQQTQRLYAVGPAARALGLTAGMTLAEARAIHTTIITDTANPAADAAALEALARYLVRYTPLVALDGRDGILMDVTGCPHLFGGERAMLADIKNRLARAGITACAAMAETVGAAWALARYKAGSIVDKGSSLDAISPLPVRALRLDDATSLMLNRLGLKTIGSITELPRAALARRFRGNPAKAVTELLERLDQTLGRREEPISPLTPLPEWQVKQAFMEPAQHLEQVELALTALVDDLCLVLAEGERGARRLRLDAYRVDGTVQSLRIGLTRPSRDKAHMLRLFNEKLAGLDAGFGFDLLTLSALESERLMPAQVGDLRQEEAHSTALLMDRLAARLGPGAVLRLRHNASHLPERAQTVTTQSGRTLDTSELGWNHCPTTTAPRPLRLLPRPEPVDVLSAVPEGAPRTFRWRRVEHRVVRAEGPERIANEWWTQADDRTRDYYRVEVTGGSRFWLFRRGLYAVPGVRPGESELPDWFLHGFFA
jgi:protein ImuB